MNFYRSHSYEKWAPVVGRISIAFLFLFAAYGQIPGSQSFLYQVQQSAAYGVPFATLAVTLAFILEVVTGAMLVLGWHARLAAFILAPYTLLLAVIFYHRWSDPMQVGFFISHLGLIAGLLYISVFGAQVFALKRDR